MDTAYNRRIASANDAIMERYARHAPANFVGKGFGSDSGLDTQYNDVMRGAANHPRALSRAEKEYRMEGGMRAFGGAGYGGRSSATIVGVTMPYREVPYAGVVDKAISGSAAPKFPLETKVQVGNMDGSGKPQVEAAWYENFDDFSSGRNRMKDSKKVGRMTKDPELVASGGRDFTAEELKFVQDLLGKSGAGFYGGAWYNDWNDFTEAVSGAYDTVKGVWEDYVKPVLDVVGTPLKDALVSSGNPYGEAGAGVLELLGYGQSGVSGGASSSGVSGGMYGAPGGRSGGRAKLVKGSPEAKAYMASIRAKRGAKGGMGMKGCGDGVFADAKPIAANSLGFSPKLEVEQLNAATGSTSYGDMPSSNPVGSGIGGRRRKIVPKNSRGVSSAPTKMGEGYEDEEGNYVVTPRDKERHEFERYASLEGNISADAYRDRMRQAGRDLLEQLRRSSPDILEYGRDKLLKAVASSLPVYGIPIALAGYVFTQEFIDDYKKRIRDETKEKPREAVGRGKGMKYGDPYKWDEGNRPNPYQGNEGKELLEKLGYGKKISRKTAKKEREGLLVSGDNSMGAIVAERGYSQKAQKKSGAVDEVASQNIWDGTQMENTTGRSAKKINNLILNGVTKGVSQGGAMSGGAHPLIQTNNLQAVYGGSMSKMKKEYSGKGQHGGKSAYNAFVSKVMKEKGMKLMEAVKYIKQNGLYKK